MKTLNSIGEFGYMALQTVLNFRYAWRDRNRLIYQLDHVGVNSIPLVLLVGFFAGAIIAWQAAYQFKGMVSLAVLGGQSARVIVMEMGPVLAALVVAGRIGASMTAEIGSMKVTEQIDALRTMAIDPVRYVVMPRVFALTIMMPVLTLFAIMIAIVGAYAVSNYFLNLTSTVFFDSVKTFFLAEDLFGGLFKAFIFGITISTIGCYMGLTTSGGAEGVGKSTIRSFVLCAVMILVGDFLLWLVLF